MTSLTPTKTEGPGLADTRGSAPCRVRLHRGLVQRAPAAQLTWIPEPRPMGGDPPQRRPSGGMINTNTLSVEPGQVHGAHHRGTGEGRRPDPHPHRWRCPRRRHPWIVSLHDTDARPIAKGRLRRPVEFVYQAHVSGNSQGIIVDHLVEIGNRPDPPMFRPSPGSRSCSSRCPRRPPPTGAMGSRKSGPNSNRSR
jgi:hypothetical protein